MSICNRCGKPVEFRYVNGRCVPLHVDGGCSGFTVSSVNDFSGSNRSQERTCFPTNCPECGDEVFFIRHNNGSVWVDPPLGWPWYKHRCFGNEVSGQQDSLATTYKLHDLSSASGDGGDGRLVLGIVKSTNVRPNKTVTEAIVDSGGASRLGLKIKNNAGYLFGKLVIVDNRLDLIFPAEQPDHRFDVISAKVLPPEYVNCEVCGVMLKSKNVRKHMKRHERRTSVDNAEGALRSGETDNPSGGTKPMDRRTKP